MPPVVIGAPYWAPKLHVVPVMKFQPLYLIAGIAWMIRVISTNPSMSSGMTAVTRPIQRSRPPLLTQRRSAAPARGAGAEPAPPSGAVVTEDVMNSAADRVDQVLGHRYHVRRERLEVDCGKVLRACARRERPVQERLERRRRRRIGLRLLYDCVLVVDDRVPRGRRGVDQRLRS